MQIPAQTPQTLAKSVKAANTTNAPQKAKAAAPIEPPAKVAAHSASQASRNGATTPAAASKTTKNGGATLVPRSYVMVISSYENVARNSEITSEAAEQLGKTIENRLNELNKKALREIEDLPEYKKLEIDNIKELGEEISDMLTDEEDALKAFAFLKNPVFANLMESNEKVHRSFADMMQDNGEEKLLFGALQTASLIADPKAASSAVDLKA